MLFLGGILYVIFAACASHTMEPYDYKAESRVMSPSLPASAPEAKE